MLDGPVHSLCARRLWQYTQGNTLYLRYLLDSEVEAGRITRSSGMWLWERQPELSPTLAELVEARIARAPEAVRDVLDALAVTEPLDSDVLEVVAGHDALADAESLGLVRAAEVLLLQNATQLAGRVGRPRPGPPRVRHRSAGHRAGSRKR